LQHFHEPDKIKINAKCSTYWSIQHLSNWTALENFRIGGRIIHSREWIEFWMGCCLLYAIKNVQWNMGTLLKGHSFVEKKMCWASIFFEPSLFN
jgi:hypothetical protein